MTAQATCRCAVSNREDDLGRATVFWTADSGAVVARATGVCAAVGGTGSELRLAVRTTGLQAPAVPTPVAPRRGPKRRPRPAGRRQSRQHAAAPRAASRGSIVLGDRAGARKAVPITRGQELGLRFRPDEAESPYAQGSGLPAQSDGGASSTTDQSQFRPTQPRRRKTYEELQAEEWQQQAMPPLPYPPLPPAPMMPPTPVPPWPIW